jgi:hypothetical protein
MPFSRRLILAGGVGFVRLVSGVKVTDVHNGLRALSRTSAASFDIAMDRMSHASEILDHVKGKRLRFKEVPVDIYYSKRSLQKGQSSWNAFRIAFDMLYTKFAK